MIKDLRILSILVFASGMLWLSIAKTCRADCWYETRRDNGAVIVHYDASVAAMGYATLMDSAVADWVGISSKVTFALLPLVSGDEYDTYFVASSHYDPLVAAQMLPYKKLTDGSFTIAGDDEQFHHCGVILYDTNMTNAGLSYANKKSTAVHEIGHSLKLAHPGSGSQRANIPMGTGHTAVMVTGPKTWSVQAYDASELRAKWGS